MKTKDSHPLIWAVVKSIPRGKVATYGQVAKAAGFPTQPRLAGHALSTAPPEMKLPWHRVIGAGGKIVFTVGGKLFEKQKGLLEDDGVVVVRGRVDMARYQWQRRSEAPVLD